MNKHKVFIFGYYGFKNIGDDAMGQAIVNELTDRGIDILKYNDGDNRLSTIKSILKADTVFLGGGTHLRNWGTRRVWCSVRIMLFGLMCRVLGKRFNMANVGVDGEILERIIKRIANIVTIRDESSMDSAILLNFASQHKEKLLGINLTPVNGIYYKDQWKDIKLEMEVCRVVRQWQRKYPDWRIQLFSFNANEKYKDEEICRNAASRIPGATLYHWQPNIYDTLSEISKCSVFIGMRYHSLIFAYMTGTPFIAIESYPRCRKFNDAILNPVRSISMDDILDGKLAALIFELMDNYSKAVSWWLPLEEARKLAREGIVI